MEVGISSRAPLLLNGGGNGIVKSKGIGNGSGVGVGAHPMRHHHIGIKVRRSLCYVVVVVTPPVLRRNRNRAFLPSKVAASRGPASARVRSPPRIVLACKLKSCVNGLAL